MSVVNCPEGTCPGATVRVGQIAITSVTAVCKGHSQNLHWRPSQASDVDYKSLERMFMY